MIELTLPNLGKPAESATVAAWEKTPGDWVARDDTLCRVVVDGQEMEVHSLSDGYLRRSLAEVGDVLGSGDSLAEVEPGDESEREELVPAGAPTEHAVEWTDRRVVHGPWSRDRSLPH
jgi:pyruvate/2-oxoglutarate dehydrogenase complex dihydrolipoamide acyltransferase (E2) component